MIIVLNSEAAETYATLLRLHMLVTVARHLSLVVAHTSLMEQQLTLDERIEELTLDLQLIPFVCLKVMLFLDEFLVLI